MKKGEFGFINDIKSMFKAPEGFLGIGDDCAVIPQESGFQSLVSVDMLVQGSHFILEDITPYQLGWKSAAVNFSDMAAMGGEPTASFLAISVPADIDGEWLSEFMRGYADISQRYGVPLLGGDTTASHGGISICVTIMGRCRRGMAKLRSAARVSDLVCVTGNLGDSGLGLDAVLRRCGLSSAGGEVCPSRETADALIRRHYLPSPRMDEGRYLGSLEGVHAMMDISDGVASDLLHILEASGVDAELDAALLPVSDEARTYCRTLGLCPEKYALCGGEDYELLFTVDPDTEPSIDIPHTVVGRILPRENGSIRWKNLPAPLEEAELCGFRHF